MLRSVALVCAMLITGPAIAGIISVTNVNQIAAPASVAKNALVDDMAYLFTEKTNFTTLAPVTMDVVAPGTYTADPGNTPLAANSVIDSYFLHFDVVATALNSTSGSVTFNTEVIGIIANDVRLANSHGQLGAAVTTYWAAGSLNGIWDSNPLDSITLSADRRTVRFAWSVGNAIDSVRIITAASATVPEPATLGLVSLALFGAMRRRQARG